jgi:phosphoribosylanthranilate isomerase
MRAASAQGRRQPPAKGRMTVDVKICGLTSEAAMDAALDAGARYVGLVFFPKSPRHLDLARAQALAARARGRAKIVALLVDPSDDDVQRVVDAVRPDVVQLHGSETPARVAEIAGRTGLAVIKAIKVATREDARTALDYAAASLILFDAKPPPDAALPGGNGRAFDWSLLEGVRGRVPFMLSGGLDPDNVAEALASTQAGAVDVSSGVETSPGEKSPELIRRFIAAVSAATTSHV